MCRLATKVWMIWQRAGISIKEVTDKLTEDGVKLFAERFRQAVGRGQEKYAVQR